MNENMFGYYHEEYYDNGTIKFEGQFKSNKANGYGKSYYDNGNIQYEGNWNNGTYDGDGTLYDKNGSIVYSGKWVNGHKSTENRKFVEKTDLYSPKLKEYLEKLNSLIGLMNVKKELNGLINFVRLQSLRNKKGLKTPSISLHMVYTGNPGTGKTTVARLISQILFELGYLSKGHLIETNRGGLVAGYLGQTALKTEEVVKKAIGGVLFIDEAYSLSNDDEYGQEAIDTILKLMEDYRNNLVVIVAGYPDLMANFIDSNPGLASRFNRYIEFTDYTKEELLQIFDYICKDNSYEIDSEGKIELEKYIVNILQGKDEKFGNARTMRNIFEKSIMFQANRIMGMKVIPDDLSILTKFDIQRCLQHNRKGV